MELTKIEERQIHKMVDRWADDLLKTEGRRPSWGDLIERFKFYETAIIIDRGFQRA